MTTKQPDPPKNCNSFDSDTFDVSTCRFRYALDYMANLLEYTGIYWEYTDCIL